MILYKLLNNTLVKDFLIIKNIKLREIYCQFKKLKINN